MGGTTVITSHKLCSGLIGHWKLEEAGDQVDSLGVTNMTVVGTVTRQSVGKLGSYGVKFASTGILTIPATVYQGNYLYDQFTLSFWIKIDTLPSVQTHDAYLFYIFSTYGGTVPILVWLESGNDRLNFTTVSYNEVSDYTYSSVLTDVVNFFHVVCVCNGIGGSLKVYINGADDTQRVATLSTSIKCCDSYIRIGNSTDGGSVNFSGTLDDIGYWRRALTTGEITTLYAAGAGLTYPFI